MANEARGKATPQATGLQRIPEVPRRQLIVERRYEEPDQEWSRRVVREKFLDTVNAIQPEILRDLTRSALGHYREVARHCGLGDNAGAPYLFLRYGSIKAPLTPDARKAMHDLREVLSAWAGRWNLNVAWCIDAALYTLVAWASLDRPDDRWHHSPNEVYGSPFGQELSSSIEYRTWNPLKEERKKAKARLLEEFSKHLDEEFEAIEQETAARGFQLAPEMRQPDHLEWLARFVVKRDTYEEIARSAAEKRGKEEVPRQTVTPAIKKLAEFIELPLTYLPPRQSRPTLA